MTIDTATVGFWWSILTGLCGAASIVYMWITRRSNVTNETMEKMSDRVDAVEIRMTTVEQAQKHAPTASDLTGIREDISRIAEGVASLSGKVSGEDRKSVV